MALSADDVLLPHAVERLVDVLDIRSDILVAYPDFDYIDETGKVIGCLKSPEYDYLYMLRRHKCIVGAGALMRRKALYYTGGRDLECRFAGDYDFWLRLGLRGEFIHVPETLAQLRDHPGCQARSHHRLHGRQ